MNHPSEMFEQMFNHGNQPESYEPVMPLSKKEQSEWDRLDIDYEKARSKIEEIEAKRKLFWIKMERKAKIFDRELKIDGGILMAEVISKSNCSQHDHTPIEGFCNGNCEECALNNPEETDEDIDEIQ